MFKQLVTFSLLFSFSCLKAQTIQFQFCGKTEQVTPVIDPVTGKDQRGNAAVKLDFIKIGVRGGSQTAPFFVLGNQEVVTTNVNFKDKVLVDGCTGAVATSCTACTSCTFAESTTGANIGTSSGKYMANVKVQSSGNDLYIIGTEQNNVVCYETHKISLAGYGNKKIDVYYKYEGIAKNNPSQVRNISLNYRFNNDSYFATPYFFNKNSSNVGVFEDVGSIFASVPVATEDLSKKLNFEIAPNPVKDEIKIKLSVFQNFNGFINIINENGTTIYSETSSFDSNIPDKLIRVSNLKSGNYILNISDEDGRASVKKFQKL